MHPISQSPSSFAGKSVRALPLALLVAALLSTGGCGWMRTDSGYQRSPESRPLEVPPDLDVPQTDPTMSLPAVAGSPARSASASAGSASAPFVVADAADSVWRRVGLALERIEGVEVTDRAQVLSAYGVRFGGEEFLIRVSAEGDSSRISAATTDGAVASGSAAQRLLGLLRQRLG